MHASGRQIRQYPRHLPDVETGTRCVVRASPGPWQFHRLVSQWPRGQGVEVVVAATPLSTFEALTDLESTRAPKGRPRFIWNLVGTWWRRRPYELPMCSVWHLPYCYRNANTCIGTHRTMTHGLRSLIIGLNEPTAA